MVDSSPLKYGRLFLKQAAVAWYCVRSGVGHDTITASPACRAPLPDHAQSATDDLHKPPSFVDLHGSTIIR
jgi:hypothetical protein